LNAYEGETCEVIHENILHSQNVYKFSAIERMWCFTDFWRNSSEQFLWTAEQNVSGFLLFTFSWSAYVTDDSTVISKLERNPAMQ